MMLMWSDLMWSYEILFSYSRTEKINWENLLVHLFKFFAVIFITYCIFMRFNVDVFKNVGREQFNRRETALIIAGSMAAGAIMMFLMFYGILHCWLNVFAELTRFGDKEFYQVNKASRSLFLSLHFFSFKIWCLILWMCVSSNKISNIQTFWSNFVQKNCTHLQRLVDCIRF